MQLIKVIEDAYESRAQIEDEWMNRSCPSYSVVPDERGISTGEIVQ